VRTEVHIQDRVVEYDEVTIEEAARLQSEGATVIDVRTDDERAEKYVEGSIHIPLHELQGRIGEVPAGRALIICSHGKRSAVAAELLEKSGGRSDVSSIAGGTQAWEVAGQPTVRP
jgi:rhodanese-related sulfurtransferase